jgi:hypothetical protein
MKAEITVMIAPARTVRMPALLRTRASMVAGGVLDTL